MKEIFAASIYVGLLFLWGSVILDFVFTGRIASYLHPFFHPWAAVGGFVLLALGAYLISLLLNPLRPHFGFTIYAFKPFGRWSLLRLLILVLPLATLAIFSPNQFSENFLLQRGIKTSPSDLQFADDPFSSRAGSNAESYQDFEKKLPKNASGALVITPLDVFYASQIEEMRDQLENKDVEILGQFLPFNSHTQPAGKFQIIRMFVICCAADAIPLAVQCIFEEPIDFPSLSWLKAMGKILFPIENGELKPTLQVKEVKTIEAPIEKFIY